MSLFEILAYASVAILILAMIMPDNYDKYEYLWQK
jgi:hypothetical protein